METATNTPIPSTPITIEYVYDPLYRLTEANYSTGDYYHYEYDPVGNRLTETTQLSVISYQYDDANRLTNVGSIEYTWDDAGNLRSDGVNTYDYDAANRLISVNNQSTVSSFQYNGLGDRLSQTVDSVTTNYTLDLNTGLTQVLDDGANTYLYGLGRVSQTGSTMEYFLGDALGSVRQLTNASGAITLTKSYQPYGKVMSSMGSGASPFAYTGEQQDVSGLTYLRARYYASGDGIFLSRDTWKGDVYSPMSFNRWMYTEGNPINRIDPTGNSSEELCSFEMGLKGMVDTAEKYVMEIDNDEISTYVAGGIAIQCTGLSMDWWADTNNGGKGIAQVTDKQTETPYGDTVVIDGNARGNGVRCYIRIGNQRIPPCSYCFIKAELDKMSDEVRAQYRLEPIHAPTDTTWAVKYMRRRIVQVLNDCPKCTDTDRFIVAALAQNGGFLTRTEMQTSLLAKPDKPENLFLRLNPDRSINVNHPDGTIIDWKKYFDRRNTDEDTYKQLTWFYLSVNELRNRGWYTPNTLNWSYLQSLTKKRYGDQLR